MIKKMKRDKYNHGLIAGTKVTYTNKKPIAFKDKFHVNTYTYTVTNTNI